MPVDKRERRGHVQKSRTKEQIFTDMHRRLRVWNSDVPESPDRLDPIIRILLQLYADQLERIDQRIEHVWDVATSSLIRSLCPECVRWPVPAYTVMQCEPSDQAVTIDTHTRFYYRERREGGQTFFFTPLRDERLVAANIACMYLATDSTVSDAFKPATATDDDGFSVRSHISPNDNYRLFVGIDHSGAAADFTGTTIFLTGQPDVCKMLRWGYWYPGSNFGEFYNDSGFCPGVTTSLANLFSVPGRDDEWGGLRTSTDLFQPLENSFVVLPPEFTSTWEMGPIDPELKKLMAARGLSLPEGIGNLFWIRIDLPRGGDKAALATPFGLNLNSFIAVNRSDLTLFKHTGGNRLVEIDIPEDITHVLEVTSVVDSQGRDYVARHRAGKDVSERFYSLEERDNKLILWFDFSSKLESPPDSLTVHYAVTADVAANGIETGQITELYENHPGINSVSNIIPAAGAIPAKSEQQVLTEVSSRLRSRDRAMSFAEISRWAMTFDPRIKAAACENGVERGPRGVRRCIVAKIRVDDQDFYSEDELALLQSRLGSFLKSRSPVNTHFRVEIEL